MVPGWQHQYVSSVNHLSMKACGDFRSDQVSIATREKIEQAGGQCVQYYDVSGGYDHSFLSIYLPEETCTMSYGYLLPGNVPLYVESHYEIYHGLQRDERVLVHSLR